MRILYNLRLYSKGNTKYAYKQITLNQEHIRKLTFYFNISKKYVSCAYINVGGNFTKQNVEHKKV